MADVTECEKPKTRKIVDSRQNKANRRGKIKTTARGFEPLRAEPTGFLVHHLNHSVTLSSLIFGLLYQTEKDASENKLSRRLSQVARRHQIVFSPTAPNKFKTSLQTRKADMQKACRNLFVTVGPVGRSGPVGPVAELET